MIGQISGTQYYRDVQHYDVCAPQMPSLRLDESLFFADARAIEDMVQHPVAERPQIHHVLLNWAAINGIDARALECLELIMHRLADSRIRPHLSEVRGPVMDRFARTDFLRHFSCKVFLWHHEVLATLAPFARRSAIDAVTASPERPPRTVASR